VTEAVAELNRIGDDEVQTVWSIDPITGKLDLNFHEGQARAWLSRRRFVFMLAGTQGGKTA